MSLLEVILKRFDFISTYNRGDSRSYIKYFELNCIAMCLVVSPGALAYLRNY